MIYLVQNYYPTQKDWLLIKKKLVRPPSFYRASVIEVLPVNETRYLSADFCIRQINCFGLSRFFTEQWCHEKNICCISRPIHQNGLKKKRLLTETRLQMNCFVIVSITGCPSESASRREWRDVCREKHFISDVCLIRRGCIIQRLDFKTLSPNDPKKVAGFFGHLGDAGFWISFADELGSW